MSFNDALIRGGSTEVREAGQGEGTDLCQILSENFVSSFLIVAKKNEKCYIGENE